MRRVKFRLKFIAALVTAVIAVASAPFSVNADSALPDMPSEYGEIVDSLPESVADELPEGMLDGESVGEALTEAVKPKYLMDKLLDGVGAALPSALSLTCILTGLIVISALIRALTSSAGSSTLSSAFGICSSLAIFSTVIAIESKHISRTGELLSDLNALMQGMIPVTGIVWAMGGNVSTASAGSATLYFFLSICESLCANTIAPVCIILTVTALCSSLSSDIKLGGVSGTVKKAYNFTLGFVMSMLVAILGIQTTLTSAADGLGAKAARLVSSSVIPIVGGSVGDTLRSVASSVEYVKSVFGISAIIFIAFLVLPTLLNLLMTRAAFSISSGVADMLGCERESRLLSEISNIYGCMIGVCAMSSVMFILGLTVFVKTAVAIA